MKPRQTNRFILDPLGTSEQLLRRLSLLGLTMGVRLGLVEKPRSTNEDQARQQEIKFDNDPRRLDTSKVRQLIDATVDGTIVASIEESDRYSQRALRASVLAVQSGKWGPGHILGWGFSQHAWRPSKRLCHPTVKTLLQRSGCGPAGVKAVRTAIKEMRRSKLSEKLLEIKIATDGILIVVDYKLQCPVAHMDANGKIAKFLANKNLGRVNVWIGKHNAVVLTQVLPIDDAWERSGSVLKRHLIISRRDDQQVQSRQASVDNEELPNAG